jgi:hypothetical protein
VRNLFGCNMTIGPSKKGCAFCIGPLADTNAYVRETNPLISCASMQRNGNFEFSEDSARVQAVWRRGWRAGSVDVIVPDYGSHTKPSCRGAVRHDHDFSAVAPRMPLRVAGFHHTAGGDV